MEESLVTAVNWLLAMLALPSVGLPAIFMVSLVSATLLPMGSEPAVFGYLKLAPDMFWPAVLVATAGNTAGGAISYALGFGAERAVHRWKEKKAPTPHPQGGLAAPQGGCLPLGRPGGEAHPHLHPDVAESAHTRGRWHKRAHDWLHRMGPPALLLSWLPAVGDPLCAVAGWLKLSFWPCVLYMAVGKFLRYLVMTAGLLWFFSG